MVWVIKEKTNRSLKAYLSSHTSGLKTKMLQMTVFIEKVACLAKMTEMPPQHNSLLLR